MKNLIKSTKRLSSILIAFAFFSLLTVPTVVELVRADLPYPNMLIASDGLIVGTNNIKFNENIYTFTGNVTGTLTVEKSNIIIDGAGHAIQGVLYLNLTNNVTVTNLHIDVYGLGGTFGNCTFEDNYIDGIDFMGPLTTNNTFRKNTIYDSVSSSYYGAGNYFFENNFMYGGYATGGFAAGKNYFDKNYWQIYDNVQQKWIAYNGTDSDGDGIGDEPYVVYSDGQWIDNHPLILPVVNSWPLTPPPTPSPTIIPSKTPPSTDPTLTPSLTPLPSSSVSPSPSSIVQTTNPSISPTVSQPSEPPNSNIKPSSSPTATLSITPTSTSSIPEFLAWIVLPLIAIGVVLIVIAYKRRQPA